jgi:radical SAM protein with 4Fe4S-binding SPASM domain
VTPDGVVTPCPYLPIELGSIRKNSLRRIWDTSEVLKKLRNPVFKGRCGRCEFAAACGGCRARAFAVQGDYMAEDPWCLHRPGKNTSSAVDRGDKSKSNGVVWNPEAKSRMARASAFLRRVIERRVEHYAMARGMREITPELLMELRERWGNRRGSFTENGG